MLHVTRFFFFFNDPATTEIYPLPLHDALPIFTGETCPTAGTGIRRHRGRRAVSTCRPARSAPRTPQRRPARRRPPRVRDRKSTRLNSSHANISYAVFCLKKKKNKTTYKAKYNN